MLLTILGAIVVAAGAIEALTGWGRQLVSGTKRLARRREPDHRALHSGPWQVHLPPDASSPDARITVFCAPSRSLGERSFDMPAAVEFARTEMRFPGEPKYSGLNDGARLEPDGDGSLSEYAWVCTNGRLDLSVSLPVTHGLNGRRQLAVAAILAPIATLAAAIRSPAYDALHGLPTSKKPRHVDWLIGVSMYSQVDGSSQPSWNDLIFPGRTPGRIVADRQPFCPATGYGTAKLRGWDLVRPTSDLLKIFLASFLAENGYYDLDAAIGDAVALFSH